MNWKGLAQLMAVVDAIGKTVGDKWEMYPVLVKPTAYTLDEMAGLDAWRNGLSSYIVIEDDTRVEWHKRARYK